MLSLGKLGGILYVCPTAGALDLTHLVGRRSIFIARLLDGWSSSSLSRSLEDASLSESLRTMAFPFFGTLGP